MFTYPKIAAEVSAPLSKTDEIVLVGDDRVTGEVNRLVSQLPPSVQALTGVDLSKVSSLLSMMPLNLAGLMCYYVNDQLSFRKSVK